MDAALERLGGASLLTLGADGRTVAAHRLTMRVVAERAAQDGSLARFGTGTAVLLRAVTRALAEPWQNRAAARDAVGQIIALHEHLAPYLDWPNTALVQELLGLRGWAI